LTRGSYYDNSGACRALFCAVESVTMTFYAASHVVHAAELLAAAARAMCMQISKQRFILGVKSLRDRNSIPYY